MNGKVTYRQQYTRCGKQRCRKCREGEGHGPYWYAYWSKDGHTVSKYIGAHLPPEIAAPLANAHSEEAPLLTANPPESSPMLRVYLLGQFQVERRVHDEWQTIDSRVWQRRRVRALLGCLLSSPGRRLGREQVMEAIWPDLEIDVAANRLNGAVHELRQLLEPDIARPAASRLLRLEHDILQLADSTHIWVDADVFEQLLKEGYACSDPVEAERLLERADALYRGSYLLEELYSEWATRRRDVLQRRWIGLLLNLARLSAERGAIPDAIEVLDRLRAVEPLNETALQHLMIFLTHIDRRGEAIQTYHRHEEALKQEGAGEPLPESRALFDSLRQGAMPPLPAPTINRPALMNSSRDATGPFGTFASSTRLQSNQKALLTRPLFHASRHNQSQLVGREREYETMRQVLLSVEKQLARRDTTGERRSQPSRQLGQFAPTPGTKQPHFLLLQGEPGIGKTRLAEELSLEANKRGWAVAWSRAYEQEGAIPYRPWAELLRTLLYAISADKASSGIPQVILALSQRFNFRPERLGALLPEWVTPDDLALLQQSPSLPLEQERLHLWEAARGLLSALSSIHPLLLVFDDMHWADESSIDLLSYILHHARNERIVVVGTSRDAELSPTHKLRTLAADLRRDLTMLTLAIQPLTPSQISVLLSHLPPDTIQHIQAQAAGNPFFAEELARYVDAAHTEEGNAHTHAHHTHISSPLQAEQAGHPHRPQRALPEPIAAVLERRLGRLSSECQALLGKAAVLGGSFEVSQLHPLAPEQTEDMMLDLLDEALKAGLLAEEENGTSITYQFWHPLIVSHLYERLSAARRALLHRKAAESLKQAHSSQQQEKVAATIVYHLSRGSADAQSIAHYAELAGNNAYALAAYSEAQRYYLQALHALCGTPLHQIDSIVAHESINTLIQHTPTQRYQAAQSNPLRFCRLLERVAECCSVLGEFEDARHLYEYVLMLRTGDIFQAHDSTLLITDTTNASEPDHTQATEQKYQQQEAQIQALLWREIGATWIATGDYDNAYACNRRGKEVMYQAGVTTGAAWACLHLQYGALLRLDGNYAEARRYLEEALLILEQSIPPLPPQSSEENTRAPEPTTPIIGAIAQNQQLPTFKKLPTRTERALIGDAFELGFVHEQLGIVAGSMGQLSEGLKHMHTALTLYERLELFTDTVRICGNLGAIYIMKSELAAARTYLQRSFDLAERIGDIPNMAFVTLNLGDVANRTGNLLESENWLKRSLALSERINDREHMSWCYVELAGVQQDLGHLQEAAQSLLRAISIGRAIKSPRCIRYAQVSLGNLRIAEATIVRQKLPGAGNQPKKQQARRCQRLLARARSTLQRAIAIGGLEAEAMIDGKLHLATVHFMQENLASAYQMTLQTLAEGQEHETARIVGRAQCLLGRILATQGNYAAADAYFEQALQVFRKHGLLVDYARALHGYGTTLLERQSSPSVSPCDTPPTPHDTFQRGLNYLHEARLIFATSQSAIDLSSVEQTLATYAPSATTM
jgi:predicted ATPase/DNA-binding SARP family transcriptional activator